MYLFSPKSVIFAVIIKNQLTMNRTITTILACICYFAAYAQSGRLFNTDHQLSSNLATQVFQDNNGFIWIATRNGLNVFDGYNFRSMRKGENDPRKPNTNCFNCITQDSHGCIVLGPTEVCSSTMTNTSPRFNCTTNKGRPSVPTFRISSDCTTAIS